MYPLADYKIFRMVLLYMFSCSSAQQSLWSSSCTAFRGVFVELAAWVGDISDLIKPMDEPQKKEVRQPSGGIWWLYLQQ